MTRTYIIARYKEDITRWITMIDGDYTIIQKETDENVYPNLPSIYIPNLGREGSSWILWILGHYTNLPEYVTFLQGNPLDHTSLEAITTPPTEQYTRHGQLLECDMRGAPHHPSLNMRNAFDIMLLPHKGTIQFCMGAQFTVSRDKIRSYSYLQWAQLFHYSVSNENAPWELERLWETLFA
jgi:hypothetical protein